MPSRISGGWIRSTPRSRDNDGAKPASFENARRIKTGVKEASDVVALPGGSLLVVSDTSDKVTIVGKDGKTEKLELPGLPKNKPSQFEGVAYDPVRHHLLLSREEKREVWRYEWNPEKGKKPKLDQTFDVKHLGGPTNKGIEGLAYLSGEQSPTGRPQLLGVKEGQPRELLLFDDGGGGKPKPVKLEDQVKDVCKDFSAVAVDPKTGNIFVSSDASSTVAQIQLVKDKGELKGKLVQSLSVRDDKGKPLARIEGLTFNAKGDLFVLTENDGALLKLDRK